MDFRGERRGSSGIALSAYNPGEDAKKMQGNWELTSATSNGQQPSGDAVLTIEGNKYIEQSMSSAGPMIATAMGEYTHG